MITFTDGTSMTEDEYDRYFKFKPSILQRLTWFFWPTLFYLKWKTAQNIKRS